MQLATKSVVVIVVVVLVLLVVGSFFLFRTGSEISRAEAEAGFSQLCTEYGKRNCAWDVTEEGQFASFVKFCKLLWGEEREAFSCLYVFCSQCSAASLDNLRCEGVCHAIDGQKKLGNDVSDACGQYAASCAARCGACA